MNNENRFQDCRDGDERNRLMWEEIFAQTPTLKVTAVMEIIRNLAEDLGEEPLVVGAQLTGPASKAYLSEGGLLPSEEFEEDDRGKRKKWAAESIARIAGTDVMQLRPGTYIPDVIRIVVQEAFLRLDNQKRKQRMLEGFKKED